MKVNGTRTAKAIRNILARNKELSSKSKSSIKSALVVQGGAMRGVFSAGALIALYKLGLNEAFDAIYSSSGGAMNAAYFLSKQPEFGTSIYYEDINNSKFINLLRVNKIVDIDYLFDEIVKTKKHLDVEKIINAKTPLYFFVTDIEEGTAKRLNSKSCEDFLISLKASCALPVYYNRPVFIDGKAYLDGGIRKAIPIQDAINDGCTDILVLLTEPYKISMNIIENFVVKSLLSRFGQKVVSAYLAGYDDYNYAFEVSLGKVEIKKNVNIATIIPDNDFRLNRLTKSERLLKDAAIEGARRAFDLFGEQHYDTNEILRYN